MDKRKQVSDIQTLCTELPLIEDRLRRAGLYETATALNMAIKKAGYEGAEVRDKLLKEMKVPKGKPKAKFQCAKGWAIKFPDGLVHPAWIYPSRRDASENAPSELYGDNSTWDRAQAEGYKLVPVAIVPLHHLKKVAKISEAKDGK